MPTLRSSRCMADPPDCSCRISISGRAPNGCGACRSWNPTSLASGSRPGITSVGIHGKKRGTTVTDGRTGSARRLEWQLAEVRDIVVETPRVKTFLMDVASWQGHLPGQHVDIRLTAEDGYQAQRSYSIASPPEDELLTLTVERLDNGEVSPYLVSELRAGDHFELRGPIGGYFVWSVAMGGPLCLVAGGSGVVPLMAMLRHRERRNGHAPTLLLYS